MVMLTCALVFAGCNRGGEKKSSDNVSRMTSAYLAGEDESYAVTVEFGRREKNFLADGKATDVADFCEITVTPLKSHEYEKLDFTLTAGEKSFEGIVDSGDFGEFKASIALDFMPESVKITAGETSCDVALKNVLENCVGGEDVVNIAKKEFEDRIKAENGGELNREIYVKLISGDRDNYYYYVSFIGEGVDYWALLIEPATGNIVSKK